MGAWIETPQIFNNPDLDAVAPYVGAWIETMDASVRGAMNESHPTWVRGLKLKYLSIDREQRAVAPYVGAWIETLKLSTIDGVDLSHPTWVRGLKQIVV